MVDCAALEVDYIPGVFTLVGRIARNVGVWVVVSFFHTLVLDLGYLSLDNLHDVRT